MYKEMLSRLFLFIAIVSLPGFSFAQHITMKKSFGGVTFETDTLILSSREVLEMIADQPLAFEEFRQARTNYSVASVLGFAGGLMIALPVVSAIAGSSPQWGYAAGGAILILTSVPLIRAFTRHAQQALDYHNRAISSRKKATLHFTGTGLAIRF